MIPDGSTEYAEENEWHEIPFIADVWRVIGDGGIKPVVYLTSDSRYQVPTLPVDHGASTQRQ